MTVAGVNMISQSCEIDHSECHCGSGRQTVSQICQARSPDKNLGATDLRAPVNRKRCLPFHSSWYSPVAQFHQQNYLNQYFLDGCNYRLPK